MISARLLPQEQMTDLVTYQLIVNGDLVPGTTPILSVEVIHEVNRIPTAIIRIADGDAATGEWAASSGEQFELGNEIEILSGYHSEDELIFKGIVTKQCLRVRDEKLELEIECKHQAIQMTGSRNSRQFLDVSDSDVISLLLDEYDLAANISPTNVTHGQLIQYNTNDWDFILSRLEANSQLLIANLEGIDTVEPEIASEPVAILQLGANLLEFDAEIDAQKQYGTFSMQAWDPSNQALVQAEASDSQWSTVGDFDPSVLAEATGRSTATFRHAGSLVTEELQAWADNALLRSRMSFLMGRARTKGIAAVTPGMTIELAGLGSRFNGPVWVSGVRHEISNGSWTTDIQLGLDGKLHADKFEIEMKGAAGIIPAVNGLHTGTVAALEGDPEGNARIQVKVPSVSMEEEGVWCRIATLDAGSERGTFFLPEIDDEVVISFLNNDPRQGVVLGMLHSSANPPPFEAADDNHLKGYVSRSDIRIEIDDDKKILALRTPAGKSVILDEDGGVIQLADENGNSVEMSSSGITITSAGDIEIKASGNLKLEGGMNLEAKASVQCKIEGSAGINVSSSGMTEIKGSMVMIN